MNGMDRKNSSELGMKKGMILNIMYVKMVEKYLWR